MSAMGQRQPFRDYRRMSALHLTGKQKGRARCSRAALSFDPLLLGPDRVGGALDEGLDLDHVLLLQLAGEVGHSLVAERSVEYDLLQIDDLILRHVAEVTDVAALVDAGYAMTGGTGCD